MEVSDSLKKRAFESKNIGECGHWFSTLCRDGRIYKLYSSGRRISQLLVLRCILIGDPIGRLSNDCGRSDCVNPYHWLDASDRDQRQWRMWGSKVNIIRMLAEAGLSWEDVNQFGIRVFTIEGLSPSDILDQYGMTHDMGCYHCGKRFDPLAHRNQVICPECWTDEDQAEAEANLVD